MPRRAHFAAFYRMTALRILKTGGFSKRIRSKQTSGNAPSSPAGLWGHRSEQLVERDRQLPHALSAALLIAFATAAPTPVMPISPMPRTPSRLCGSRMSVQITYLGHVEVDGHVILGKARVHHAAGAFVEFGQFAGREA